MQSESTKYQGFELLVPLLPVVVTDSDEVRRFCCEELWQSVAGGEETGNMTSIKSH
jgi:hypothetical protein